MAYHPQPEPNPFWSQATWIIDPANSTGLANDNNSGIDAAHPLLSYNGGVVTKWGTTSPILRQNTTLTWLSSQPVGGADPVILEPVMVGGSCIITGALGVSQQVTTGAFAAVVARVFNPAQLLEVTPPAGPALAVGNLIHNTTLGKDSWAFVNAIVGGGVVSMEQPLSPVAVPFAGVNPAEVNSWLMGDTFVAYEPCHVNLVRFVPVAAELDDVTFANPGQIKNIVMASADGVPGDNQVELTTLVTMVNVRSDCEIILTGPQTTGGINAWIGCDLSYGGTATLNTEIIQIMGGKLQDQAFAAWYITSTFLFDTLIIAIGQGVELLGQAASGAEIWSTYISGQIQMRNISFLGAAILWGPGTPNFFGPSRNTYGIGGRTAVATFLQAGAIHINGSTNANPFSPSAGTWQAAIAITPANLDAVYGPAGFGGNAVNPGGASLSTGGA